MPELVHPAKAAMTNPLKMSAPLGAAMAFMGLDSCMPMLHGSQGCTSFALVALVRHFKEAIPFQTTAMNEVTTILGGIDNIEQAIVNVASRAKPNIVAIASTGLVETRGEDIKGDLKLVRAKHPELDSLGVIYATTPDYIGGIQQGWEEALRSIVEQLVPAGPAKRDRHVVNILAGCHLTPADLEEIRDTVEAFGLKPILCPDISGSLDGHVPEVYKGSTFGGTTLDEIKAMGRAVFTLGIGEATRAAAALLEKKTGVGFRIFPRLTGLAPSDHFIETLMEISGKPAPAKIRRRRSQLVDAMLDGHFHFGGKRIAIGAEPDLLATMAGFFTDLGAEIQAAVTTCASPVFKDIQADTLIIGDLDDLERLAAGCDLMVSHSQAKQGADRLGIELWRIGFPCFDRIGAQHKLSVLYKGTRDLVFEAANLFMAHPHEPAPHDWVRLAAE